MPDFLKSAFALESDFSALTVLSRLLAALILGVAVAGIYRGTRGRTEPPSTFPTTLVLLTVLIAMVTQVIGDNVARAFSLVGALSIVRFRTVVRDTQDTAYVIFAVAIGMAIGAHNLWAALIGLLVVGLTAFLMSSRNAAATPPPSYLLSVRLGLANDPDALLGDTLNAALLERKLTSLETARQGASLDVVYEIKLRPSTAAAEFIKTLNRIEGVQSVGLHRHNLESI